MLRQIKLGPDDDNLILIIAFPNQYIHVLIFKSNYFLTDIISPDRKFTVSTVYEYEQLHPARTSEIKHGLKSGADGSPGKSTSSTRMIDADSIAKGISVQLILG